MLNRMIQDDDRERQRLRNSADDNNNNDNNNETSGDNNNDNNNEDTRRPWFYSNQRRQFERSLMAQVQWIWRHQEYLRELTLREQGLPPPQLKLKVSNGNLHLG
jgi:hypothetical protein